jgi:hypothetical protein
MDSTSPNSKQADQPSKFTDEEARSLLAINSLDINQKAKSSRRFLVVVIGFVILVVVASIYLEVRNHSEDNTSKSAGSTSSSTKNPFTTGSSTVNNEVKYCSNPVNAQTTC